MNTQKNTSDDCLVSIDAIPDALFILGPEGQILNANLAGVQLYGYSLEELKTMKAADFVHPDFMPGHQDRMRRCLAIGDKFESKHRSKNGTDIPIEIFASSILFEGKPAILASVRNITERKLLEEQIRYLADHDSLTNLPNRRLFDDREPPRELRRLLTLRRWSHEQQEVQPFFPGSA